jgi:mannose-6-phosphate isomerase class I
VTESFHLIAIHEVDHYHKDRRLTRIISCLQALFLGPNIPHAYLDGDGIECMSRGDNVV